MVTNRVCFREKHLEERFHFRKKMVAFLEFLCKRDMETQRLENDFGRKRLRVNAAFVSSAIGRQCWHHLNALHVNHNNGNRGVNHECNYTLTTYK